MENSGNAPLFNSFGDRRKLKLRLLKKTKNEFYCFPKIKEKI